MIIIRKKENKEMGGRLTCAAARFAAAARRT
jgi:hypothetical protein